MGSEMCIRDSSCTRRFERPSVVFGRFRLGASPLNVSRIDFPGGGMAIYGNGGDKFAQWRSPRPGVEAAAALCCAGAAG